MRRLLAVLIACALLSAACWSQGRTSFGGLSYETPTGWTAQQIGNALVQFRPSDAAPDTCIVALKPAEQLNGGLAAWFDTTWQGLLHSTQKVIQSTPPQSQGPPGAEPNSIAANATVQTAPQRKVFIMLFGFRYGRKVIPLLVTAADPQLLTRYQGSLQALIGSLRVDGTPGATAPSEPGAAPPAAPNPPPSGKTAAPSDAPPPRNRLSGVYAGFFRGYGPGSSGVFELRAFVFYPDGTGMYLPEVGLDGFDFQTAIRSGMDPLNYGTYEYHEDGRMRFTSQSGPYRDMEIDVAATEPGLKFARVCRCTGAHFSGAYYWGDRNMAIAFAPDGRFLDRGAMHDAFQFAFPNNPGATNPGAGTYRIVDYTIYLDYSDGRRMRFSFVVEQHPTKSPTGIWIKGRGFHLLPGSGNDQSPAEK
jgi:hypothetical protein